MRTNIGEEDELVRNVFDRTLDSFRVEWGATNEVICANTPGDIFSYALFYRIREYWISIKEKLQNKPTKAIAVKQLVDLFEKTAKHIDDLFEV